MSDVTNIPANWASNTLINIADYHNGGAFKPKDWIEDGLPIIRIEQLNKANAETDKYGGALLPNNFIDTGDLIFSWSATLKVVIWNRGPGALNQHLYKVVPKPGISRLMLLHILDFNMSKLAGQSQGSTMKHVTRKELSRFKVVYPKRESEQQIVATILGTIDQTIEKTEALIEKYQQIKAGLMHDLFTRGIAADGKLRPPREHAPELYQQTPIGWIPKEWEDKTLVELVHFQRGHDIVEADFVEGVYPVISSGGVIGFHNQFTSQGPSVVMGRKGTIGKVHYVDSDYWAHDTSLFSTNLFDNEPWFVYYLCIYMDLAKYGTKSGSPSLNRNDVHPLPVGKPSPDEQKKIVLRLKACDTRIDSLSCDQNKLRSLKFGLMHDLLTGKVQVKLDSKTSEMAGV